MSGNMVQPAIVDVVDDVGSAEKENADMRVVLKLNIQWRSNRGVKVAAIRPLPRSGRAEKSLNHPQSPALTFSPTRTTSDDLSSSPVRSRYTSSRNPTRTCPFSFDLRDSMQRVAREERLERLRLQEESNLPSRFRANPVRKYKPLVLQQSSHLPTVPRSPFSHRDPVK